jgi:hypothetical protein
MSYFSGTGFALSLSSGSTKTARDKNKKSDNTPPQTSKQATNEPRESGASFFPIPDYNLRAFHSIYKRTDHCA